MNQPILQVSNVGKAYRQYHSEISRILSLFGFPTKPAAEKWVLRGISFEVLPGEAVGIVGRNGAGKSTLLKLITGTQRPSEGQIISNGRIAAILELGMGFNPDFTGRQNVYHSAGLMGFNRHEIEQIIPEVETFSDIGDYFDQPINVYSSGMQMRVGFALSTAIKPKLLIIDEALSVGDAAFQRKCFRRIEKYLNDGMSLLLVSHDIESIKKSCSKALFLSYGQQKIFDVAKVACDEYEQELFGFQKSSHGDATTPEGSVKFAAFDPSLNTTNDMSYGDGSAKIEEVWLEDKHQQKVNVLSSGSPFSINFSVVFNDSSDHPIAAFLIKTVEGISLYGLDTSLMGRQTGIYKGGDRAIFSFHISNSLSEGAYFINCGMKRKDSTASEFMHRRVDVLMFKVRSDGKAKHTGLVDLKGSFSWKPL